MIISLLVAASENNVIGKDNALPWTLPSDMRYFKNQTWGLPVISGRKTYESLGKPLPGRKNIIITRNKSWTAKGTDVVHTLEEGIEKAVTFGANEVFIIGGAQVFKEAMLIANRIYITRIHHEFEGDTFFPDIDPAKWMLMKNIFCHADAKNAYSHTFQVWERSKISST
jgi:Dihydrofolate reductase